MNTKVVATYRGKDGYIVSINDNGKDYVIIGTTKPIGSKETVWGKAHRTKKGLALARRAARQIASF